MIDVCERMGLDVMSAGVVLSWATEALEKGLITTQETLDVPLEWNNVDGYIRALESIVRGPNEFYSALLPGAWIMPRQSTAAWISPWPWARTRSPATTPARPPSWANWSGVRHSHLDNAGYSIDQKAAKKPMDLEMMVDEIIKEDNSRGVFNCLVGCLFARGVYTEENIMDALGAVGIIKTKEDLQDLGKRIFDEKYKFKVQEGFDLSRVRMPNRFYETVSTIGHGHARDGRGDAAGSIGRREAGARHLRPD